MADFNQAVAKTIQNEGGGKYTNNPNDPGGPTKYGITIKILSAWRMKTCTAQDVQNLQQPEAQQIYKAMYWDKVGGDQLNDQVLAEFLFDMSVNQGPPTVVEMAQAVVGTLQDGNMGPHTIAAINAATNFKINLFKKVQLHYVGIVVAKPEQELGFLKGWINRTHELLDQIV